MAELRSFIFLDQLQPHLVGVALDQSDVSEIVGTICGDDTIFVAAHSVQEAELLAAKLRALSSNLQ